MSRNTIVKGAIVALCLIGMLVLPAAAAQTGQPAGVKGTAIDQGLKEDLWANHVHYRLARYDLNVEQAANLTGTLDRYGVDTTDSRATLSAISAKRPELAGALAARDRMQLKTVNNDLKSLWKEFLKDVRGEIRSRYGKGAAATVEDQDEE